MYAKSKTAILSSVLFAQTSSYSIDMPFKVAVVDQLSEDVLHKGRNGAGVKAELFFIRFYKVLGKHHVSDTKRWRDRFGKGIQIYDVIVFREGEQRVRWLGGNRELRFKVIFNDISVLLICPANVFVKF